jgi:rhodanese-related sulfurtransferase
MGILKRSFLLVTLALLSLASHVQAKDISADQLLEMDVSEHLLIDVRTPKEFSDGFILDAVNMPVAELPELYSQIKDKDQKVVVYCRSGVRAGRAISFLEEQGFTNVIHLDGDFGQWSEEGRKVSKQ